MDGTKEEKPIRWLTWQIKRFSTSWDKNYGGGGLCYGQAATGLKAGLGRAYRPGGLGRQNLEITLRLQAHCGEPGDPSDLLNTP